MQLVVGRILRPHGVRGEVVVDVRTDSPGRALRRRVGARDRPGGGRPADHRRASGRTRAGCWSSSRASPTGMSPTACAGSLLWSTATTVPARTTRTSSTTISWSGCGRETPDGERLGEVVRVDHAPAQRPARAAARRTAARRWCPFVAGHRARGRHRRRPGGARPRPTACSIFEGALGCGSTSSRSSRSTSPRWTSR